MSVPTVHSSRFFCSKVSLQHSKDQNIGCAMAHLAYPPPPPLMSEGKNMFHSLFFTTANIYSASFDFFLVLIIVLGYIRFFCFKKKFMLQPTCSFLIWLNGLFKRSKIKHGSTFIFSLWDLAKILQFSHIVGYDIMHQR